MTDETFSQYPDYEAIATELRSEDYDRLVAENDALRAALTQIRDSEGKVCEEYETCEHASCRSSYAAWAIADAALAPARGERVVRAINTGENKS